MILIIIIIILIVIYYRHKNKQQEQLREENIMQGSDFQPIDESSSTINNVDNPFIDNSSNNISVDTNNTLDYSEFADSDNPFVSNDSVEYSDEEEYEELPTGYDFPLYPSKVLGNTNRKIIGKFSYDSQDYVALSYNINNFVIVLFGLDPLQ